MHVALLVMLVAADVNPEPPPAPKVIASYGWYGMRNAPTIKDGGHLVVRSAAELVKAILVQATRKVAPAIVEADVTGEAAGLLKVRSIDWTKQMLVVVAGGLQPTSGHRVEVVGLKRTGDVLTVSWKLHKPVAARQEVFTYPVNMALVPAHKGKVAFEQQK
jgi:hypothetical protein